MEGNIFTFFYYRDRLSLEKDNEYEILYGKSFFL